MRVMLDTNILIFKSELTYQLNSAYITLPIFLHHHFWSHTKAQIPMSL